MLFDYKLFEDIIRHESKWLTEEEPKIAAVLNGDFLSRYNCMQSWFLRCSWLQKLDALKKLFDLIKDRSVLPVWSSIIHDRCYDKLLAYIGDKGVHDFPYDNMIRDNNRCLEENVLQITIESDLEWFKHFDEYFQDGIYLSLCFLAGGSIFTTMCKHMMHYYKTTFRSRTSQEKLIALNMSMEITANISQHRVEILLPGDLGYKEVQQKRLDWDKKIEKYRREVEGKVRGNEGKGKDKGGKGSKKSSRTDKSTEKKSKTKRSKKDDKQKESASVDYLQLMPIKVVKMVFGYLNKKTLKKIKAVNSYWAYAVTSLEKELKARKGLNKYIRKLEADIKEPVAIQIETPGHVCRRPYHLARLEKEGTCNTAIRKKLGNTGLIHERTLKELAITEMQQSYLVMVNHIKPFPRKQPKDAERYTLFKPAPCIQFEGGSRKRVSLDKIPTSGAIAVYKKIDIVSPQNSISVSGEDDFDATQYSSVFVPHHHFGI